MFINSFRSLLLTLFFLLFSCSDDNKKTDSADDSGAHTDTDIFFNTDSGTLPGDTDDQFGLLGDTFRFGINGGHRNLSWGDDVQAELEQRAGCNSSRISLPERHLDQWGYEIEVNDMKAYESLGLTNHVAFLTSPIRAHSTAP
ncbi:MAG: hypothetical protein JXR91_05255, partial [Deltaproteobacteria bacterium]|nr:hypothetical protein [Deltaproteobacteria bacterium]